LLEWTPARTFVSWYSSKQILEAFEYGGVYDVERRIFEQNPPVRRRFLHDPQVRR